MSENKESQVVPVCFWSGEDKVSAPEGVVNRQIVDYEPCARILEAWSAGIVLIEVGLTQFIGMQPAISEANGEEGTPSLYPSGRWLVVDEPLIEFAFAPEFAAKMKELRRGFIHVDLFNQMVSDMKANGAIPQDAFTDEKPVQ